MNRIMRTYFHKAGLALAALMLSSALSSCDSAIYDGEGDCSVTYRMEFRYDLNMKWADAFAHEVKSVHLYAFDDDGLLVWQQAESGAGLSSDDYAMTLDLPAGHYRMLAWCGLENDGQRPESFTVPVAEVGKTHIEELRCALNRQHAADGAYCGDKLYSLFHGMLDETLPDLTDGGEYTCMMPLTKDTNHIRVILQHLSGEDVDEKDYTFRIEAENGLMDYDNDLLPDESITYKAYSITPGITVLGPGDYPDIDDKGGRSEAQASRAGGNINVAVADLSIPRLVVGRDVTLIIESADDGHTVASVPLTSYAMMLMSGYDEDMEPQEFLDRQDEYALTFFLDENDKWPGVSIIINSWRIVLNNISFD